MKHPTPPTQSSPAKAMVASGHPLVSEAAMEILSGGGNAFDAVIGAGFVSAVAEPALTSLGGGGFLMARTAAGETTLFDFFSNTPGKGLREEGLTPHFFPVSVHFTDSVQDFNVGLGSVAVPGTLKGFLHIHDKLGTLPFARIMAPAIKTAVTGVALSDQQAHFLELLEPILTMTPAGRKLYAPEGRYPGRGDVLANPDLARFLEEISHHRSKTFYEGTLADLIDRNMRGGGGLLTAEDLSAYEVIEREPIEVSYRGRRFKTNPPPSFGGSLIAMALEELERSCRGNCRPGSPEYLTAQARAMLQVEKNRCLVHNHCDPANGARTFSRGTTHISVVDAMGNVASMTNSNGEGSGYIVPGTGIMLNNMMGEDDLHPDGFHASPPGQRVASMMSPSLLLDGDRVILVIGSGGSKRIRTAITQVVSLIVDCGIDVQEAVTFPRIHWDGEVFQVEPGFPEESLAALARLGEINLWSEKNVYFGGVHAVMPRHGGGGDPRRGGAVRP